MPLSVPAPFAQIAQECLRLDPALRCTLDEIGNSLQTGAPIPHRTAKSVAKPTRKRPVAILASLRSGSACGLCSGHDAFASDGIIVVGCNCNRQPRALRPLSKRPLRLKHLAPQQAESSPPAPASQQTSAPVAQESPAQSPPETKLQRPRPFKAHRPWLCCQGRGRPTSDAGRPGECPCAPFKASSGGIQLNVDANGTVRDASIASQGPSRYFANLALQCGEVMEVHACRRQMDKASPAYGS